MEKKTIILVHGFADNAGRMGYMANFLRKKGWHVLTPTLRPSNGTVPIETLSSQLATFIYNNTGREEKIYLVGYSMGGLICRYYLQCLGGFSKTSKFIAISTPHYGTITALLFKRVGIKQMQPNSLFLQALNRDVDQLAQIPFTIFYTPMDLTILPARSCIISGAQVIRVLVPVHVLMVYAKQVLKKLEETLSKPA